MTKEEMTVAVKKCAEKLGRAPSQSEFRRATAMGKGQVRKHFGTFRQLLEASGLEARGSGHVVRIKDLFLDWAKVVRELKKTPTLADYELHSRYSPRPLVRRFGAWVNVPVGMAEYARKESLEGEYEDVLRIVMANPKAEQKEAQTLERRREVRRARALHDRPIYGMPMFSPFSFAPTNEQGVLFVLGAVAPELGLSITRVQTPFPDVEAMREVGPNQCQRVTYELEYESKNFLAHMHPLDGCDGIVCWIDNWPECPLEVIELRRVVEEIRSRKDCQDCQDCQNRRK